MKNTILFGKNSVLESLQAGREIDTIYTSLDRSDPYYKKIRAVCKGKNIVLKEVRSGKLDTLAEGGSHQGICAMCSVYTYCTVDEILQTAADRGEAPFIILADGIEDPHNLGAVIRTAECAGAHGVILSQRRCAAVTATVEKTSAGATAHMKIARVVNLVAAMEDLKKKGIFLYGADMDGTPVYQVDFTGAIGLVIGSEGRGMSRLVREKCDVIVSLPQRGKINSLNASVAGGILMYEVVRVRG